MVVIDFGRVGQFKFRAFSGAAVATATAMKPAITTKTNAAAVAAFSNENVISK